MNLKSRLAAYGRKRIAQMFSRKLARRMSNIPIISFTFDDFPRSAVKVAGAMLAERGLRGTYYASLGLMGKQTDEGEMYSAEDLRSLVQDGHELACHTFSHIYCPRLAGNEVQEECCRNRRAAAAILGAYRLRNFSFPSGAITWSAKSALAEIYDSCRTVEWGINCNPIDLGFLRANPLYSQLPTSYAQRLIAENSKRGGWLIFYTHDIRSRPSAVGCTPNYFSEILSFALASGASILTIGEGVSKCQVPTHRLGATHGDAVLSRPLGPPPTRDTSATNNQLYTYSADH